jgi:hypothetical protein
MNFDDFLTEVELYRYALDRTVTYQELMAMHLWARLNCPGIYTVRGRPNSMYATHVVVQYHCGHERSLSKFLLKYG